MVNYDNQERVATLTICERADKSRQKTSLMSQKLNEYPVKAVEPPPTNTGPESHKELTFRLDPPVLAGHSRGRNARR